MEQFWMVWSESGRAPTYKHESEAAARKEAERLTRLYGGRFHVLEAVAACERVDVTWESFQTDRVN